MGVEAQAVFVAMTAMAIVAVVREDGPDVFFEKLDLIDRENLGCLSGLRAGTKERKGGKECAENGEGGRESKGH